VETYHLREHLSLELLQRELEATVAIVVEHLDRDHMIRPWMRRRGWSSHDVQALSLSKGQRVDVQRALVEIRQQSQEKGRLALRSTR
jgi:hypothetical protein